MIPLEITEEILPLISSDSSAEIIWKKAKKFSKQITHETEQKTEKKTESQIVP